MRAIRTAEHAAWAWADTVREGVEQRSGIAPDDLRVLDDPVYAAALDRCSELQRIGEQAARELAGWQKRPPIESGPSQAPAGGTEVHR
jgi:hypothetical protein